ncbi:MAG: PilZ domain-containing protein [Bdellovibrionales bacterium]|nr:PilZ domain-containing protein [Bdellovibrionales bacterium]
MSDEVKQQDRRKFVRVITKAKQGQLEPIEELTLKWSHGKELPIFDISYGGVASEVPDDINLNMGEIHSVAIVFPNRASVQVAAEVVWLSGKLVGLNFEPLSLTARTQINDFLDAKIVGQSLRLIDQQYYSPQMTCQYWYQGNYGVNLYLWEDKGVITKGEVVFDNSSVKITEENVEWSRSLEEINDLKLNKDTIVRKAIDLLGQIAVKEANVQEFLRRVLNQAKRS